ncbi:hypothetical protein [Photorhabdus heterorhabditis]|uniref:hypothetical protein n=1 Tax=Photorhabdus heterorhabditis TaxID=880156 RepID=UPI0015627DD9|nr:hypothetical protein [Photorhabdus heterorhabditis]NRN27479.1 hypothetical protein [Photorhabdus heterorhabditis subsp. aluminescens]
MSLFIAYGHPNNTYWNIPVIFQVASLLAALTHSPRSPSYLCSQGFASLPS